MTGVVGYAMCSESGWETRTEFEYEVDAKVEFGGFDVFQGLDDETAWKILRQSCIEADKFTLAPSSWLGGGSQWPKRFVPIDASG